jgi:RND family efflux transporter MFP subunit
MENMRTNVVWFIVAAAVIALLILPQLSLAQARQEWSPSGQSPGVGAVSTTDLTRSPQASQSRVEAVVVNPYRSANVGAQVSGVIVRFHLDEGDLANEGQVLAEIDPVRYEFLVQRATERVKALEAVLEQAEEEAKLRDELVDMDAGTRRDVLKAKSEAVVARHRLREAQKDLDLARFDLEACKIKAPFSGYLALRYKQPDETVDRLEKVFSIVDSSKVLAVANVPETLLNEFKVGTEATFVHSTDKKFKGKVERVGKLIDPKSKTKRVYLLIDNSGGSLEVGMSGSLDLAK